MATPLSPSRSETARTLRAAARDEGGYLIVELMVGTVVMVILALGTLQAFDGAAKVSATTKTRAIAASLAQEEQERVRGLSVDQLNGMNSSATQTIGGITYTIGTKTQWIADASSSTSCASNGAAADYLKATTTVTPNKSLGKPVVLTSLVTAPVGTFATTQGSLAISIADRDGVGVPNIPVSTTGPSPSAAAVNETSDSNGCVFLGYLAQGSYTVAFSKPGYVDKDGNNAISKSGVTVTGESTSTAGFSYDVAGSANVTFDTKAYGSSTAVAVSADVVSLENGGISGTGRRVFGTSGTFVTSITATNLFPFSDTYSVYAGDCTGEKPASPPNVTVPRGGTPTPDPTVVRLPSINVTIRDASSGGSGVQSARVRATPTGSGCSGIFTLGGSGATTNASGQLTLPAAPYGTYTLCADKSISGTNHKVTSGTITNSNADGTSIYPTAGAPTLVLNTSSSSGTCS